MKGIGFLTNEKNERIAVQTELKAIVRRGRHIHELIDVLVAESRDVLVAESRKDDEKINWKAAKRILKKKSKI